MIYNIIVIDTTAQFASTVELHSRVICGITVTLVSEQSTELSKGLDVIYYPLALKLWELCLTQFKILKTIARSLLEVRCILSISTVGILPSKNRNTAK